MPQFAISQTTIISIMISVVGILGVASLSLLIYIFKSHLKSMGDQFKVMDQKIDGVIAIIKLNDENARDYMRDTRDSAYQALNRITEHVENHHTRDD